MTRSCVCTWEVLRDCLPGRLTSCSSIEAPVRYDRLRPASAANELV